MSVIRVVLACLCLLLPAGARAAEEQPLIPNLDFSDGLKGWGAWTGTTEHPWSLDAAVGHGGKPSLRIDAANRAGQVMVMANTDRLKPSERYALEVWWRLEKMSTDPQVDLRVIFRDDKGGWLTGTDLYPISSQAEGEWTRRRYRISTPARAAGASFGIWVRETTGVIRVSDMSVRPQPVGEFTIPSMYDYDPDAVLLGMAPLKKFQNLKETNSPFLARAKRWNQLLVNVGYWQEDVSRARRVLLYAGRKEGDLAAHVRALDAALAALDRLQQTYGRLYVAGKADALAAEFDPPAAALDAAAQAGQAALRKFVAGAAPAASGKWLAIPKAPTDQPWWDPVKKRPRYMLWLRWSDADFRDLEEPLNMGDCQTLTAGAPGKFENGVADWQNYLDQQKKNADAGARRFALITHYSLHDKGYLAPEFAKQQGGDPDLRLWDKEGKPQGAEAGVTMFNWLNPKVLAHMDDVLGQMARFFKDRREFQFYVDSWESAGPYAGGVRVGRNPSHAVPFREYLRARYGTLAALNARWGTHYTGFETITPAPEAPPAFGAPATPLAIESQRWAQEAYVDYLTRIRGTIAREDPTKPVLGEHSGLLGRVLSPRVVDSVDILGYHHRANTTMPLQVWMTSLQRVTGKPLGLYENFWGCQEDAAHARGEGDARPDAPLPLPPRRLGPVRADLVVRLHLGGVPYRLQRQLVHARVRPVHLPLQRRRLPGGEGEGRPPGVAAAEQRDCALAGAAGTAVHRDAGAAGARRDVHRVAGLAQPALPAQPALRGDAGHLVRRGQVPARRLRRGDPAGGDPPGAQAHRAVAGVPARRRHGDRLWAARPLR